MTTENNKRRRIEEVEDVELIRDDVLLQMVMNGEKDGNQNEAQRQMAYEEERARKRRIRQERMMKENEHRIIVKKTEEKFREGEERGKLLSAANKGVNDFAKQSITTGTAIKEEEESNQSSNCEEDDEFDMFSCSVSPPKQDRKGNIIRDVRKTDDFQDAEGYYKATIGEILELDSSSTEESLNMKKFKVLGVVGKGVFSTVLKCSVEEDSTNKTLNDNSKGGSVVALKLIRRNDTMSRAAETEVEILHQLQPHRHIVALLSGKSNDEDDTTKSENSLKKRPPPLQHYVGHVVVMFPYLPYNVRDVLAKFGKGVGLSLAAVQSYLAQLLSALAHLSRHHIIHADLKPDNLLVSEDFSTVQVCDFGSAMQGSSAQACIPTPYLVSRFYRAPEVILGFPPTPALDLWSIGVTTIELFTGNVLFPGSNNNNMIQEHLLYLGAPSNKVIRQHLLQVSKLGMPSHFAKTECKNFVYLQQKHQSNLGQNIVQHVGLTEFPTKSLSHLLLKSKSLKDSRSKIQNFCQLSQSILTWDPLKRIPLSEAQAHPFFSEDSRKKEK